MDERRSVPVVTVSEKSGGARWFGGRFVLLELLIFLLFFSFLAA